MGLRKGQTNNPDGKNQWENNRASRPISARLPEEMDWQIRAEAQRSGKPLTQVAEEAFGLWLERQLLQEGDRAASSAG